MYPHAHICTDIYKHTWTCIYIHKSAHTRSCSRLLSALKDTYIPMHTLMPLAPVYPNMWASTHTATCICIPSYTCKLNISMCVLTHNKNTHEHPYICKQNHIYTGLLQYIVIYTWPHLHIYLHTDIHFYVPICSVISAQKHTDTFCLFMHMLCFLKAHIFTDMGTGSLSHRYLDMHVCSPQ